jgi:hypothetical protein
LRTVPSPPTHEPITYEVLSCTISDQCLSTAALDDEEVKLPEVLVSALSHLQLANQSRIIFNDHLALLRTDPSQIQQLVEGLPRIHQQAEKVIVWAGTDDEDDYLSPFIGRGNVQSTRDVFEFARRLSGSPISAILDLFKEYDTSKEVLKWARFQQLVYRDFFRGDSILSSNYIASLPNVVVQLSSATIPYPILQKAADLLLRAHPLPKYLTTLTLYPPARPLTVPQDWPHDKWWVTVAYRNHLKASIRFGIPTQLFVVYLHYLAQEASEELKSRLATHWGFCDDILNERGGWNSDTVSQIVVNFHHQLANSDGDVSAEAMEDPVGLYARPTPDFDGKKMIPTPVAAHREAFVHSMTDEEKFVVLLEILPDADLGQPLQCGLREIPSDKPFEFAFVTNHMFLRPPLYEKETSHSQKGYQLPPLATRKSTQTLISGRSYPIPTLQEIFLRLHRHPTESKYVYLWNVCQSPQHVGMFSSKNLKLYAQTRECVLKSEVQRVQVVDMYKVLETAAIEQDDRELEKLRASKGIS